MPQRPTVLVRGAPAEGAAAADSPSSDDVSLSASASPSSSSPSASSATNARVEPGAALEVPAAAGDLSGAARSAGAREPLGFNEMPSCHPSSPQGNRSTKCRGS